MTMVEVLTAATAVAMEMALLEVLTTTATNAAYSAATN